jgi:hypothetical protein
MKTIKTTLVLATMTVAIFLSSCEFNRELQPGTDMGILPERFKIDIPNSLSNEATTSELKSAEATEADTLNGNAIYHHLNSFIRVGEGAAEIVQEIIFAIAYYGIDEAMRLSFQSEEDGRIKNLVVEEDVEFNNQRWQFMLTITDAESESNPDGGKALQVFWNASPIEGIAILKPYNINMRKHGLFERAMFRIEYSEVPDNVYESYMIVEISGLDQEEGGNGNGNTNTNRNEGSFALRNMKMFVGKKEGRIDVYGNSDHPNAKFFNDRSGFSWSFVASGYTAEDIAVAEVGLPPSILDEDSREVLLKEYSIKNVLTNEITEWFLNTWGIGPDSTDLAVYLQNAEAPGFFDAGGFVQAGVAPGNAYDPLVRAIESLAPYNPNQVHELTIEFK